jgi:hypothetical protein
MEKKRTELSVVITSVTSPATIKRIAEDHGLNPQEVFVRVGFKLGEDEYMSSNKLRFFGQKGYEQLLEAKNSGEPISITLTANEKGTLLYVNSNEHIEVSELFETPVKRVDNRKNIEDLF